MTKKISTVHKPVLLKEVIENLKLDDGAVVFDGTLGGGGYAKEICQKIEKKGKLVGTDLDKHALLRVRKNLKDCPCQKYFFQKNYSEIKSILNELELKKIDALVLDLGISSDQLELEARGISFQRLNDPLDMNLSLDPENDLTAAEILNNWEEESLADIFFFYGGEKASRKVARAIVAEREKKDFKKVLDLVELLEKELGGFYKRKKIHPATKIFQALRITVNDEIGHLKKVLKDSLEFLKTGGRVAVVTFHSLEDRNVKKIFKDWEESGLGQRVNKKVIVPSDEEIEENKRARSAKLRVFEKS